MHGAGAEPGDLSLEMGLRLGLAAVIPSFFLFRKIRFFKNFNVFKSFKIFPAKYFEKFEKLTMLVVFSSGNGFLTKFGARQKNRPKICFRCDFPGFFLFPFLATCQQLK